MYDWVCLCMCSINSSDLTSMLTDCYSSHHASGPLTQKQIHAELRYKIGTGVRLEDVDSVKRSKPQKQMGV